MSAYRVPPAAEPGRPKDVRRLDAARLGTFGISLWSGFCFVMAASCVGTWQWAAHVPWEAASKLWAGAAVVPVVTALFLRAIDWRVRFTARIDDGLLQIDEGELVGRKKHRSFRFLDIDAVHVDEHGEELVAAFVRIGKKDHAVFATRIGDDAGRVAAFLEESLDAWRALGVDADG